MFPIKKGGKQGKYHRDDREQGGKEINGGGKKTSFQVLARRERKKGGRRCSFRRPRPPTGKGNGTKGRKKKYLSYRTPRGKGGERRVPIVFVEVSLEGGRGEKKENRRSCAFVMFGLINERGEKKGKKERESPMPASRTSVGEEKGKREK